MIIPIPIKLSFYSLKKIHSNNHTKVLIGYVVSKISMNGIFVMSNIQKVIIKHLKKSFIVEPLPICLLCTRYIIFHQSLPIYTKLSHHHSHRNSSVELAYTDTNQSTEVHNLRNHFHSLLYISPRKSFFKRFINIIFNINFCLFPKSTITT